LTITGAGAASTTIDGGWLIDHFMNRKLLIPAIMGGGRLVFPGDKEAISADRGPAAGPSLV